MTKLLSSAAAAAALCVFIGPARATPVTLTGSSGNLAASVTFSVSGTDLIVTLTNTSLADVMGPGNVLTSVFYDVSPPPLGLIRTSAVLGPGSIVLFGTTDPGGVVGGEWAYLESLSGAPGGAKYGLCSAGLGLFGPADLFPGSDLQGPPSHSPDGVQYGITSAGDNPAVGNAAVTGANALIKNQVIFTLSGLRDGFDPAGEISNVTFQYGTGLDEAHFPGVPSPGTGLIALLGLAAVARRRR